MDQPVSAIARFFNAYEINTTCENMPALIAQFADTFLAAGPQGSQCVRSSDFALALP